MDPRSTFTRAWVLAPALGALAAAPPWPQPVVRLLGQPRAGEVEPMERVLFGPLPRGAIARSIEEQGAVVLFGDGDALGLAVTAEGPGDLDQALPELRARVDARVAADELATEPAWKLLGVVEVVAFVEASIAPEPSPWAHGTEEGGVRLERIRSVGPGHLAFSVLGTPGRPSEEPVVAQRVQAVLSGWRERASALLTYGALALRWDHACRRATEQATLAAAIADGAGVVVSAALGRGRAERAAARKLQLRLDVVRVPLAEHLGELSALLPRLRDQAGRLFGPAAKSWGDGAFLEAGSQGERTLASLRERQELAARWSEILGRAAS